MLKNFAALALVVLTLTVIRLPVLGGVDNDEAIIRFQKAINDIKSFDATIVVKRFDYSDDAKSPRMLGIETNRDVFATGLGRRFERNCEDGPQGIGVIDWKTAKSTGLSLEAAFQITDPTLTYLNYINPSPNYGQYLTDILDRSKYDISPIEVVTNSSLMGFQIENPQATYNILRIWLDSNHGYMLKQMDWCIKSAKSEPELIDRLEVDHFISVSNTMWVPDQATINHYLRGHLWRGNSMQLDDALSSFNTISSDQLFIGKSLQRVNYEKRGWKWDYPSTVLSSLKTFDFVVQNTDSKYSHKARWIILGTMVASTLLLIFFAVWHSINNYTQKRLYAKSSK